MAGAGIVPISAWVLWSGTRTVHPVTPLAWHPPPMIRFEEAVARAVEWVVPAAAPTAVRAAALAALGAAALGGVVATWVARRDATASDGAPPALGPAGRAAIATAAFVAVHVSIVVTSAALLQEQLPIGGRLLVPAWPPLAALVVAAGARAWHGITATRPASARPVAMAMVAGAVTAIALLALDAADQLPDDELGWAAGPQTALDAAVADLDDDVVVLTNSPAGVWLRTGRPTVVVPRRWIDGAGAPNPRLAQEVDELRALTCDGAVLVLAADVTFWTPYVATPDEVRSMLEDFELEEVAADDRQVLLRPTTTPRGTCNPPG